MSSRRTMWVGTIVVWGAVALPACDRTGGESAESEQTAVERGAGRSSPSQEGGGADDRWRRVQRAKLDDSAHTRLERAKKAQRALGKRLKKELTSSISEKSFSGAVEFCHSRAPEVAAEVAEEYDVRIGRTSHRLRNPD
ncbi:MAG: hypothetical protein ABEL76_04660, partial [Bradymonadaceae bacterium]